MDIRERINSAIWAHDEAEGIGQLKDLLAQGIDIGAIGCDEEGHSVLHTAAAQDRLNVARLLVSAGATLKCEVDAWPTGEHSRQSSSLHEASEKANLGMVTLLLGAGGKPLLNTFDYVQRTPLHIAAGLGNLPLVKLLINAGANVNAHDVDGIGFVPLDDAVQARSIEVARWLLGAGADPGIRTWMQMSPIDRAASLGDRGKEVLELFRVKLKMPEREWKILTRHKR